MIFNFTHFLVSQSSGTQASPWASFFVLIFPFIFIFILFYFLFIRPQQKEEKERKRMIASLKKGDKVITIGGILGTIVKVEDNAFVLRTGGNTLLKVEKNAIKVKTGVKNDEK